MAADPPKDPFEDIDDLINPAPPPPTPEEPGELLYEHYAGSRVLVFESAPVDRDRLVHELRRSFAASHPLEGASILARIEATILLKDPAAPAPIAATCPACHCALRVLDRPRMRPVDPAERAGLLASASKSLNDTRSDPGSLEALARELARRDIVMTELGGSCPVCQRALLWPD